ncbi:hypothetical protein BABINDRAFT_159835 [Babjeviella inositovora NRRL Y-12698]|uniref:CTP-dependent diacylglycerol kinase 1 n=1 Tax=Babjeviella inositovora NRRL Y-12698 TaxID=984486 RepID=A0A1E3QV67_9ASCO|nr:uncharacterized protein BABINDRAFT_159835 [Babjeviella inositovora NRRL Y-12698]ODQ81561.1 hypothetical protein BABINDRAFT_159835 [Babjeviella inositovora NRRL Y-12698]
MSATQEDAHLRSRTTNVSTKFIDTSFSVYTDEDDSDYAEGTTTVIEDDDDVSSSASSIISHESHRTIAAQNDSSDDSQLTIDNMELQKDENLLAVPPLAHKLLGRLSPSQSTTNLILESHKRFGKFVHKYEVPRKVFHVSIGFITLYVYTLGVQVHHLVLGLLTAFVTILSTDLYRFRNPKFNDLYCKFMGFLMREKEVMSYNGVIWYLLGLVLVFIKCPKDISVMSVLLLSWADTSASTFGRMYGHLTPKVSGSKSLAGSFAAFLTGVLSAYVLYGVFIPRFPEVNVGYVIEWTAETSKLNLFTLSLLSGLVASVSEAIDIFGWDDNFTIPVISGYVLWGVVSYFKV